ncbi:MAG: TonB-dependent receptor [Smithellaceae bacterium]|nr:TonB-dependent receptor [Smithellaceae bacterium]
MSIEELMNIEVTLASKVPSKYFDTPAAVYVITSEDIRRSGATSIPELLRMVPGADVERIDSNRWAVGIRSGADRFTRTLLVMIDGRSVYSPIYGGVNWEDVDLVFEDIDRVEVVRGPGGTYWGANACTGIVNIITKKAQDTQGGLVSVGTGTPVEKAFGTVRYGGKTDHDLYYRIYAKYFDRGALHHPGANEDRYRDPNPPLDDYDEWQMGQVGFRTDKAVSPRDSVTVQGDFYSSEIGLYAQTYGLTFVPGTGITYDVDQKKKGSYGGNFLGRWQRKLGPDSDWTMQIYYDKAEHREVLYNSNTDIVDLDFQHRFRWILGQEITWGLGYRFISSRTSGLENSYFDPPDETYNLPSAFIQDDIELVRDYLRFIIGSKFEHNEVTGFEIQPSVRLLWTPTKEQTFWAAVSRAVRTPSRIDYEYRQTIPIHGLPSPPFPDPYIYERYFYMNEKPQDELSYELGHRILFGPNLSVDTALHYSYFWNSDTTELILDIPADTTNPALYFGYREERSDSKATVKTYGGEISVNYKPFDWWRLSAYHMIFRLQAVKDASSTMTEESIDNSTKYSPRHQSVLRSYMDLPGNTKLDWMLRYVAEIPFPSAMPLSKNMVSSYYSLDVRIAWNVRPNIELSIIGQNLLDKEHPEYSSDSEVPRGVYGKIRWQW